MSLKSSFDICEPTVCMDDRDGQHFRFFELVPDSIGSEDAETTVDPL